LFAELSKGKTVIPANNLFQNSLCVSFIPTKISYPVTIETAKREYF
jgi:hypothetical protein